MILLTKPEHVNLFFETLEKIEDLLEMAPKFIVLRTHEVNVMIHTLSYQDAGFQLSSLGYDFIVPVFNELPDAIEASRGFRYPIGVIGMKDRGIFTGGPTIAEINYEG